MLGVFVYLDNFLTWRRKIGAIYLNRNIFHHFVQGFPISVATWPCRVERSILVWQRPNHRYIFALFQHFRTAWQPSYSARIWISGNQKALSLMSTMGAIELPMWTAIDKCCEIGKESFKPEQVPVCYCFYPGGVTTSKFFELMCRFL